MTARDRFVQLTAIAALAFAAAGAAPARAAISFGQPVAFPSGGPGSALILADFNRDGLNDVATADGSAGSVSVLLGDGRGGLLPPASYAIGGNISAVAAGDLDEDGILDLVAADPGQGRLAWLQGQANGAFGALHTVQPPGPPVRLAVGDVNGDGHADLASSDFGPDSRDLSVELGDGAGNFGAPVAQTTGGTDFDLVLVDLNGDGRADAITSDGSGQTVSVSPGNPDGSLGPARSFAVGGPAGRIAVANFSDDPNLDIAVGHMGGVVTVLLGDGTGGFPSRDDLATISSSAGTVVAADFDRDGPVDLAAGSGGFDTFRGSGFGSFENAVAHPPPSGYFAFAAGDLDGDGAPDIAGVSGSEVVVRRNTSTPGPPVLPPPTVARTANVAPVTGTVLVKRPGSNRFIRLVQGNQVPIGSLVDTTKGTVRLTTAAGAGGTQTGRFHGGLFKIGQGRAARPITELKLTARLRCTRSRGPVHAGARRVRSRHLFGNAHGRFRTRGRHSTATIRGTKWLVKDTCAGTLTLSQRGTVVVRDLVKHRTVTLRTGQRYLARRGNR